MSSDNVQDNLDTFKHLVDDAINEYVSTSVTKPSKSPPWYSKVCQEQLMLCCLLFKIQKVIVTFGL